MQIRLERTEPMITAYLVLIPETDDERRLVTAIGTGLVEIGAPRYMEPNSDECWLSLVSRRINLEDMQKGWTTDYPTYESRTAMREQLTEAVKSHDLAVQTLMGMIWR